MCSHKTNVKNTYDLQQQRRSAAHICWSTCSIYHHRCIWHLEKTIFLTLEAPLLKCWKYSLIFSLINFHSEQNYFMWTVKTVTELYFLHWRIHIFKQSGSLNVCSVNTNKIRKKPQKALHYSTLLSQTTCPCWIRTY